MYGNREVDKKEALRAAIRPSDYSTQLEEKSFDDLLVGETKIESSMGMPSDTTLEYADFKGEIDVNEAQNVQDSIVVKEKYSISARGKALIAVYAFILISIFAFIIFNATYLRGLNREIQKTETDVATAQLMLNNTIEELDKVSSESYIIEKAIQMGMNK